MKNIHEALQLESILIRKKILWRINFVLIKFLLNALLFEKSWNECENPSFLHKAMCIESDHGTMKMECRLFTLMVLHSRRLCFTSFPYTRKMVILFVQCLYYSDVICGSIQWFTSFIHIHWHEVLHKVLHVAHLVHSEWEVCECEWMPEQILLHELRCTMTNVY